MNNNLYIEQHEMDGRIFEIYLDFDYDIENDGIGGYEFWGMRGYDKGTDYAVVTDITLDSVVEILEDGTEVSIEDEETLKAIEKSVLAKVQEEADKMDIQDDRDYEDDRDY